MKNEWESDESFFSSHVDYIARLLLVLGRTPHLKKCIQCTKNVANVIEYMLKSAGKQGNINAVTMCLSLVCNHEWGMEVIERNAEQVLEILKKTALVSNRESFSLWSLKCIDLLSYAWKGSEEFSIGSEFLSELSTNLRSGFKIVRFLRFN